MCRKPGTTQKRRKIDALSYQHDQRTSISGKRGKSGTHIRHARRRVIAQYSTSAAPFRIGDPVFHFGKHCRSHAVFQTDDLGCFRTFCRRVVCVARIPFLFQSQPAAADPACDPAAAAHHCDATGGERRIPLDQFRISPDPAL